jgi:hypothetical protein
MKPLKWLLPISKFLLRISLLAYVYHAFLYKFLQMNFSKLSFYVATIALISSIILFFTIFSKKSTLIIISSFFLIITSLYQIGHSYKLGFYWDITIPVLVIGVCLNFMATGNKN